VRDVDEVVPGVYGGHGGCAVEPLHVRPVQPEGRPHPRGPSNECLPKGPGEVSPLSADPSKTVSGVMNEGPSKTTK